MENTPKYLTVKQCSEYYPIFSESSLRFLIFNASKNGFDKVLHRIGTKILINVARLEEWIEKH